MKPISTVSAFPSKITLQRHLKSPFTVFLLDNPVPDYKNFHHASLNLRFKHLIKNRIYPFTR